MGTAVSLTLDQLILLDISLKRLLTEAKADLSTVPPSITQHPRADRLRQEYAQTRARFGTHVLDSARYLQSGHISRREFNRRMYGFFSYYYTAAMELGKEIEAGLTRLSAEDIAWVDREINNEYKYSLNFANDIITNSGSMNYTQRAKLYVSALDAVFVKGMASGLPEETLIQWNLAEAEHCQDCLNLAANGPYSVESLPTYPGLGDTECLVNCACWLSEVKE